MGLLHSTMKAEALKPGARIHPALTIAFPDRTRRYASKALASAALGPYAPKVIENGWGQLRYGSEDRSGRLLPGETTVTIDDKDFDFAMLREGAYGDQLYGSAATIDFLAPGATSFRGFTGIYVSAEFSETGDVKLLLRVDDLPLRRNTPKVTLGRDWPNSKADVLAQYAGPLYGIHDATALGAPAGAIPCPYIDTVQFKYFVCLGAAKTIRRVYTGTVLQTVSVDYVVGYEVVNGRLYTVINFFSDQGTDEVTVDVEGAEATGDTTGTLIANPLGHLEHFLHNFVWGNYQSGNWLTSTAPLSTAHWTTAKAFLDTLSVTGSRRITGEQVTGEAIVNELSDRLPVRFWWTGAGELAVLPWDLRTATTYSSDPWIRQTQGVDLGGFGVKEDAQAVIDRIDVQHCYLEAQGNFAQALRVRDSALDLEASESLDMRWSPSRVV